MRKIGLIASGYVACTSCFFAAVAMFAGNLYFMCGFEVLMIVSGMCWLLFERRTDQ